MCINYYDESADNKYLIYILRNVLEYHKIGSLENFLQILKLQLATNKNDTPSWISSLKQQFAYEVRKKLRLSL